MSEEKKIVTLAELQKHDSVESLWIAIHNKVYDLTTFSEHPGREEVLLAQAGTCATQAFEDICHSDEARELMKEFHIGELAEADREKDYVRVERKNDSSYIGRVISWFIPSVISIGIIAVAIHRTMFQLTNDKI